MNSFLERREVGGTGMKTARLGIGSTFDAPASAIEEAFEHGINYLYWGTVRRPEFARAMVNLSKQHRDELILTIQSYSKDPGSIEGEVERRSRVAASNISTSCSWGTVAKYRKTHMSTFSNGCEVEARCASCRSAATTDRCCRPCSRATKPARIPTNS